MNVATEQVDKVGRQFKDKIEAARQPETNVEMLKDVKAAPLGMLAIVFSA